MRQSVLTGLAIATGSLIGALITIIVLNNKHEPKKPVYTQPVCKECEYLFVVTDDSITVYDRQMDCERIVGTVKLEGQLDSLITADNQ
jgi:hypothetical protein